jgi:hypothetical protein
MKRGLLVWLLLLILALPSCSPRQPPHAESIPTIPPGRAKVAAGAGDQLPLAPPAKPSQK